MVRPRFCTHRCRRTHSLPFSFSFHNDERAAVRRNSLRARPPPMTKDDPYYPGNDRRYEDLTEEQIPLTESLMDCMQRGMSSIRMIAVLAVELCDTFAFLFFISDANLHVNHKRSSSSVGVRH